MIKSVDFRETFCYNIRMNNDDEDIIPELKDAQVVIRKFIQHVRSSGCDLIKVWSEGDQIQSSQSEDDLVEAITLEADELTVTLHRTGEPKALCRLLMVPGNGRDVIVDYTVNPWSEAVVDKFFQTMD